MFLLYAIIKSQENDLTIPGIRESKTEDEKGQGGLHPSPSTGREIALPFPH